MELRIRNLSKRYGNGVQALQDVSLTIREGMFGLLGPNGAGKSTLMRIIATLQEADSGSVFLDDIDVLNDKDRLRRVLGYLPQEFGLYPKVTAWRLLDHFAELKGLGVAHLYGLSTQDTGYQSEAVARLHLPFPLISDQGLELTRALELPTFTVAGMTLLKRMAWVIDDGTITKVFYPVFPPDKSAAEVIAWLRAA